MQSMPITTDVASSNLDQEEMDNIHTLSLIKFVSDLRQVGGFLRFPPPIKLSHDKTEILLKVCVKHHQTNKYNNEAFFLFFFYRRRWCTLKNQKNSVQ